MSIVFYGKSTLEHLCKYSMCIDGEHLEKGRLKESFFLLLFLNKNKSFSVNVLAYGIQNES